MTRNGTSRYLIQKGLGKDSFVELWDQSLAPGGLAYVMSAPEDGPATIVGYEVPVPFDVFERFMEEGKAYLREYIEVATKTDER